MLKESRDAIRHGVKDATEALGNTMSDVSPRMAAGQWPLSRWLAIESHYDAAGPGRQPCFHTYKTRLVAVANQPRTCVEVIPRGCTREANPL